MTDDRPTAGPLGEAGARLRALVAPEAHMIVRTLRPLDEGSWAVNELFIQKVLERFADALLSAPVVSPQDIATDTICYCRKNPCICLQHDAQCESELTSHGYTPCRCAERLSAPVVTQEGE
jgi:hypothetical protein